MPNKMNLLIHISSYADVRATNSPGMNNFKWTRDLHHLSVDEPESRQVTLAPGQTHNLFNGLRILSSDSTTAFALTLKSGTTNSYLVSHDSGTAPMFRTKRSTGADATTEVDVSISGTLATYTSVSGTLFDFVTGGVQIGDQVRIGGNFNVQNQGVFKVLDFSSTYITIENSSAVSETGVVLGVSFDADFTIYSQDGVQIGDKVVLGSGFSPINQGTFDVVDISHDFIEIYSGNTLVPETPAVPLELSVFYETKAFLYLESDGKAQLLINNSDNIIVETFSCSTGPKPGILVLTQSMWAGEITNISQNDVNIFYVTVE